MFVTLYMSFDMALNHISLADYESKIKTCDQVS